MLNYTTTINEKGVVSTTFNQSPLTFEQIDMLSIKRGDKVSFTTRISQKNTETGIITQIKKHWTTLNTLGDKKRVFKILINGIEFDRFYSIKKW
jgi:hypothetical protein